MSGVSPQSTRRRSGRRVALLLLVLAAALLVAGILLRDGWGGAVERRLANQEAGRPGWKVTPADLGKLWAWRMLFVDAVLCLVLAATVRWWWRPLAPKYARGREVLAKPGFWLGLLAVLVLSTSLRVPRLGLSLYNDEAYSFRRHVAGSFSAAKDDEVPAFRQTKWSETFYRNEMGNNGPLFSAGARVGYDAWRGAADGAEGEVREWPLRLPALLGGLLSVMLAGLVARDLSGHRLAGWLAAGLAAVHPWHLRYSTEARPHGLALGLAALVVWALVHALRTGTWRWWLTFAAAELLVLATYPGAVAFLLAVNAATAVHLIAETRGRALVPHWLVANAVAAMLWLPAFYCLVPQALEAVEKHPSMRGGPVEGWWGEATALATTGAHAVNRAPEHGINPALFGAGFPVGFRLLALLGGMVLVAGLVRGLGALASRRLLLPVGGGMVATPLIAWLLSILGGTVLHPWYVVVVLPLLAVVAGVGLARFGRVGVVAVCGFAMCVAPVTWSYLRHSKQSLREVVETVNGDRFPAMGPDRPIVCGIHTESPVYLPTMLPLTGLDDLKRQEERARLEKRPLYVVVGLPETAVRDFPEVLGRLEEEGGAYERVAEFPGLVEAQFGQRLFVLRDG